MQILRLSVCLLAMIVVNACTRHSSPAPITTPVISGPQRLAYLNFYDNNGNPIGVERFIYDSSGKLTQHKGFEPATHVEIQYDYFYRQDAKIDYIKYYRLGAFEYSSVLLYDASGNVTDTCHLDAAGNTVAYSLYTYSSTGDLIEKDDYALNTVDAHIFDYSFDAALNVLKTEVYSIDGNLYFGYSDTFLDVSGDIVEKKSYDANDLLTMEAYFIKDARGINKEIKRFEPPGVLESRGEYFYEPGTANYTETEIFYIEMYYVKNSYY